MDFTKEQQLAIDTEGKNIIVSAGAGSGKTAVLTARVIRKLTSGIDINRLLVLTFTNEAAREMKNRIRKAIVKNKLNNQLSLLDSAYITTFDSFALSIVKKYHYLLNISNDIKIIDKDIITIYKYKILDNIFENKYGNQEFNNLINAFCLKDDKLIKNFIIELSEKLDLLVDKEEFLNHYFEKFYNSEYLESLITSYLNIIKVKIADLNDTYLSLIPYLDNNTITKVNNWLKPLFEGKTYSDYSLIKSIPSVRFNKLPDEAIILKEELKNKLTEIKDLLRFENEEIMINHILESKDHTKVLIELVKELDDEIIKYKDSHEAYEFNDISHMAINIVKNHLDIRYELRDYFNEIMIDEYQDTSNLQETFIGYIGNNNVYMVGDIKQSIYRFRNANPYIFQEKYNKYAKNDGGIKIDLLNNFRSRKETLKNINDIFNLIMDDRLGNANYKLEHNMEYGNKGYEKEDNKANNNIEIYTYTIDKNKYETPYEKELFIISEDIKEKIKNKYQVFDKDSGLLRDLTYQDICIITDRNKYLPIYKQILEYHEIPSVLYMDETLTNDMVILVIKNLIHLVYLVNNNIYNDVFRYLYTSVSRSFLFGYTDNEIYESITNKTHYQSDIVNICKKIDIYEPLPVIINNILNTFNVYEKLTTLTDIEKNLVRISNLIDIGSNLSNLGYTIVEFIDYLNETINIDLPIKYSINTTNQNAVKIMNIHKSKGLEFSLCYYTGLDNKFTIKEIKSKFLISEKLGIIIPYLENDEMQDTILKDLYVANYYDEEISEKIRLFYVALTRCREKMIVLAALDEDRNSCHELVPYNKRIKYRSFLDIINSIDVINQYLTNKDITYNKNYQIQNTKAIDNIDTDFIIQKEYNDIKREKIVKEQISKKINTITTKEDIKKMEYGTNIHEMLEYADFKNPKEKIVTNLLKQIDNNFINVYHEYEFIWNDGDTICHGIIDLIVEYQNKISIIDYKLKNISDKEYLHQLSEYQKYLESITDKSIKTYLYSIIEDELKEVNNEK